MKLLLAVAVVAASPTPATDAPQSGCADASERGLVSPPATQVGSASKAIRKPSAHKGDYLPSHARTSDGAAADSNSKRLAVAAILSSAHTCERTASPPAGGGRVTVDHAINTKGTGATGRAAAPGPGDAKDCDDTSARGVVTGVAMGTTEVSATATSCPAKR